MTPQFSIIIPTCQHPALLLKCLDALGRQQFPRSQFEVIVVDDGNSSDTATAVALFTRQVARSGGALEVRYLAQPHRQGSTAARNRGWKAAQGDIVAFTDDDCSAHPDWLSAALIAFERGAQVVIGQLRLILPDSSAQRKPEALLVETGEFTSANFFCRRSALERTEGFSEVSDSVWRENSDMLTKFIQSDIPITKCPEAVVVHTKRQTPWSADQPPTSVQHRTPYGYTVNRADDADSSLSGRLPAAPQCIGVSGNSVAKSAWQNYARPRNDRSASLSRARSVVSKSTCAANSSIIGMTISSERSAVLMARSIRDWVATSVKMLSNSISPIRFQPSRSTLC